MPQICQMMLLTFLLDWWELLKMLNEEAAKKYPFFEKMCFFRKHLQCILFWKTSHLKLLWFKEQEALTRHIEVHHKLITYDCPSCQKKFETKKSLDNHVKKLGVEGGTVVCPECPKNFTYLCEVKTHITDFHNEYFRCAIS